MRIGFVSSSVSRLAGGLFQSVRRLAQSLHKEAGLDVRVLGLKDDYVREDVAAWRPLEPTVFRIWGPRRFGYSHGLSRSLDGLELALVHNHGIWMFPSLACLRWARRTARPYLVSTRGMVEPWALKNSRWKKWVVWRLFERAHLSEAACLHALCEAERGDIRALGLTNPIAVIPNGVDLPPDLQSQPADPAPAEWRGRKVMLFLSRVHPKKGLVQLVRAWAALHRKADGWVLAIAGPPQGGHDVEIQRLVDELALGDTVRQVGPQYGEDKNAWLRRACAFVLPSFSEGMPVAVLEALAYGLPVLLTPHCNLPEAVAAGAAFAVALRPDDIAEGLQQVLGMSDSERKAMGARGRSLVERKYTWPRIALQMAEVYKWVLGGGPAPETVECC